jgi:hypothetical protein
MGANSLYRFRQRLNEVIRAFEGDPDLFSRLLEAGEMSGGPFLEYEAVEGPLLEALVSAPDRRTRVTVARQLLRLGPPPTSKTITALQGAERDQDPEVRRVALDCLLACCLKGDTQAATVLPQAMKDTRPETRRAAVRAWREMGRDLASAAVGDLIKALVDPDSDVRMEAVATLAWLRDEAEAAVPALLKFMAAAGEAAVREVAFRALLAIDPKHRLILPSLRGTPVHATRDRLLDDLRRIGGDGTSLRHELEEAWGRRNLPPDGPELPNRFWWKGAPHPIRPQPCRLLSHVWNKESVRIADIARDVWGTPTPTPDQVKSTLRDMNDVLLAAETGRSYRRNREEIERD